MAEFSWEKDLLAFISELPKELFDSDKNFGGKVVALDDIFQTGLLMMPGTSDPYPQMPVQVEDSAIIVASEETVSRENTIVVPGSITKTSNDRTTISKALSGPGKRQRTTDRLAHDSASDDADSTCSDDDSREKSLEFAEQFLQYGIRCKPFFWQYNQEMRGPKAKRLISALDEGDFHVLSDCITQSTVGNSHNKANHGRGNDLQPDPSKLFSIGSKISGMEEIVKPKYNNVCRKQMEMTARERSKLASRICRLRKKAQHEANKIKLEGLQKEQSQLIHVSLSMMNIMHDRIGKSAMKPSAGHSSVPLCTLLKALISEHLGFMVAGHTVEFVNRELETSATQLLAGGRTLNGPESDGEG